MWEGWRISQTFHEYLFVFGGLIASMLGGHMEHVCIELNKETIGEEMENVVQIGHHTE